MPKVIIDRFEGNYAIVELTDRTTAEIPHKVLPIEAKEGDVIIIEIDSGETKERKKKINRLMNEVWEK